eukprot:967592-Pelagomonas_calceolata.AAC.2
MGCRNHSCYKIFFANSFTFLSNSRFVIRAVATWSGLRMTWSMYSIGQMDIYPAGKSLATPGPMPIHARSLFKTGNLSHP